MTIRFLITGLKAVCFSGLWLTILISSCRKEETANQAGEKKEWMRVFEDTIFMSADNEYYLGQSGKVITDKEDNIFLYYYAKPSGKTVIIKCDPTGNPLWRKHIESLCPSDMILLNNGNLVVSGTDPGLNYRWNKFYAILPDGNMDSVFTPPGLYGNSPLSYSINSYMCGLPDNSIIFSTVSQMESSSSTPLSYLGSVLKINPSFKVAWGKALVNSLYSSLQLSQNSVIPTSNNQYLFEFAQSMNKNYHDSSFYGLVTGLINADGTIDTIYRQVSGFRVSSNGNFSGVINRYCNGLMDEGNGNYIYHYSAPESLTGQNPSRPNGFIRIGSDALIKDTIDINLPVGYRIFSCTQNNGNYLMTAYRSNTVEGTEDYSAGQTLFIYGGSDWRQFNTFTLQDFHSDFFPSTAGTSDGGFVLMGKIQSFNGPANKLVLIKWKP